MQLDLQLSNRQGLSGEIVPSPTGSEVHGGLGGGRRMGLGLEKVKESREGSKLCAFNVDFQDINEIVTVMFHESTKTPHLDVYVGTVVVDGAECPGLEMSSVGVGPKFRSPL